MRPREQRTAGYVIRRTLTNGFVFGGLVLLSTLPARSAFYDTCDKVVASYHAANPGQGDPSTWCADGSGPDGVHHDVRAFVGPLDLWHLHHDITSTGVRVSMTKAEVLAAPAMLVALLLAIAGVIMALASAAFFVMPHAGVLGWLAVLRLLYDPLGSVRALPTFVREFRKGWRPDVLPATPQAEPQAGADPSH